MMTMPPIANIPSIFSKTSNFFFNKMGSIIEARNAEVESVVNAIVIFAYFILP
ncbi:MAG: hypothetical protein NVS1B13_05740 [Flavisolibacter sp.]